MLVVHMNLIPRLINRSGLRISHSKVFSSAYWSCTPVVHNWTRCGKYRILRPLIDPLLSYLWLSLRSIVFVYILPRNCSTIYSKTKLCRTRGFNGSVNFRSQFFQLNKIFQPFFLNTFLSAYTFWINSIKQTNP